MADVNIKGVISVETAAAAKNILEVRENIAKLKTELKGSTAGSAEQTAAFVKLNAAQKELSQASKDYTETLKEAAPEVNKSGEAFSPLKGKVQGMIPGLKGAEGGAKSFGAELKVLAATPLIFIITAIVAVLKFLYEAFQSSVEGGKQIQQVWAGIGAVGAQIKDAIFGLVRAFIDVTVAAYKFIHLDFAGAAESMKKANNEGAESMRQLGNAVTSTMGKFMEFEKAQQINDKARKIQAVVQSETNKLLVQSREILTDETASMKEKKTALEAVTAAETKSAAEKVRIAAEDLRIIKDKRAATGGEAAKKMIGEEREATIALNDAQTENAQTGVKLNKQKKMLGRQEAADAKAAAKEESDRLKELSDKAKAYQKEQEQRAKELAKIMDDLAKARAKGHAQEIKEQEDFGKALRLEDERQTEVEKKRLAGNIRTELENKKKVATLLLLGDKQNFKLKIDLINANLAMELSTLAEGDLQRQILSKKASDEIVKIEAEEVEAKRKLKELAAEHTLTVVKGYGNAANDIAGILGKQTLAGKLLAMASASINTFEAITGQLKAFGKLPIPGYAIAQAIATGAVGFANVAKIAAVQVPGGGGGTMPTPANVTAPLTPMPQSMNTRLDQSSINGIGNAAQGGVNRTFVLDSDIKNSAERMARINRAARLG